MRKPHDVRPQMATFLLAGIAQRRFHERGTVSLGIFGHGGVRHQGLENASSRMPPASRRGLLAGADNQTYDIQQSARGHRLR